MKRKLKSATAGDVVITVVLTLLAFVIFLPFYNSIVISLETNRAFALHPVSLFPHEFTWSNYSYLIEKGQIGIGYVNTIFVTVIGTALSMAAMVMMAYALSRRSYPGKRLIFMLMMFTMFFSGGMIPTYLQFKQLGLIDSLWGIIFFSGVSAYNIIILKSGFEQTPVELEDAARIDVANDLVIFVHVMLPLQLLSSFFLSLGFHPYPLGFFFLADAVLLFLDAAHFLFLLLLFAHSGSFFPTSRFFLFQQDNSIGKIQPFHNLLFCFLQLQALVLLSGQSFLEVDQFLLDQAAAAALFGLLLHAKLLFFCFFLFFLETDAFSFRFFFLADALFFRLFFLADALFFGFPALTLFLHQTMPLSGFFLHQLRLGQLFDQNLTDLYIGKIVVLRQFFNDFLDKFGLQRSLLFLEGNRNLAVFLILQIPL